MAKQQGKTVFTRWWRKRYSQLSPNLQLVGLQMWMPLFFITMFCLCYIYAFHAPTLQDMPIGYVASSQATGTQGKSLEKMLKGAIKISFYPTFDAASAAVRKGDMAAAIASGAKSDTLIIASSHQNQAAIIAEKVITPAEAALGKTLKDADIAPLPPYDWAGTVTMYLMMVTCFGGYMVAMFLSMVGGPLKHSTRLITLGLMSFITSFIVQFLVGPVIGAVHGHFLLLWMSGWLWMFTIGVFVNGIGYFTGRFVTVAAMLVFIFLSMPASGGAFPVYMMPKLFQVLNHVVVGGALSEMFRHIIYNVGPGLLRAYIMAAGYLIVGVILSIVGKRYWEWKQASRILAGETTMFKDANDAKAANSDRIRRQIFKDAGIPFPDDVPIEVADEAIAVSGHVDDMFYAPNELTHD
ncbi:MAG: ABC transporter permease [Coriobacteriia bacterium]|nr:ABC transporter permease [Coriobacteriia bacterium]